MKKTQQIEFEIQQLAMAIDYFERAMEGAYFVVEAEEHQRTIHKLTQEMRTLERKRDRQITGL